MPFTDETFTIDMMANPVLLSTAMINAIEASDISPPVRIKDPNNGFVMMALAEVELYAKLAEKIDYTSAFYYAQRARNSEQLLAHLSEFDYVKLMSSPASLPFVFATSRQWIIANAVPFDDNYNKLQIPATANITMGGVVFSMYYPIDIFVNRNTQAVSAFLNTAASNSLFTPQTDMLRDVRSYIQDGIDYFQIMFDMYQFAMATKIFPVTSEQGFIQKLSYDDQFYAAKVYTENSDGTWAELAYSLTKLNYDYTTPTAILDVLTDQNQLRIEIPQIYFRNGQISQRVKVELFTTKGAVNYTLSMADVQGITADFDPTSSVYAQPFEIMPIEILSPITTVVTGGSNAAAYDEIRSALVNQRLNSRVAITQRELLEAGRKAGFDITRVVDDLTERVYYASNTLVDENEMIVPTMSGSILLKDDSLIGDPSTILIHSDGYKTVLPTTTFKLLDKSDVCVPMTDADVTTMLQGSRADQIALLNTGEYLRQLFHISLRATDKSPVAQIFNLLTPTIDRLSFIRENPQSASQMSAIGGSIVHMSNGTGGYRFNLTLGRSESIKDDDASRFLVLLMTKSKVGEDIYWPAEYQGVDTNGNDVWQVIITTTYRLTIDEHISVKAYDASNTLNATDISLEQTFTVLTAFVKQTEAAIPQDIKLNNLLPAQYGATYTAMSQQQLVATLGRNLSRQIYSAVNTTWGQDLYEVADTTVYHTTDVPVFQTNEVGVLETQPDGVGGLSVVPLFEAGVVLPTQENFTKRTTALTVVDDTDPTIVALSNTLGILIGQTVMGAGLDVLTIVTAKTATTITLSKPVLATVPAGTELTFVNFTTKARVSDEQSEDHLDRLALTDTSGLLVGQTVFGLGVGPNRKIKSLDSACVDVVTDQTLLTIMNTTAPGVVKIAAGDLVTDQAGLPVVAQASQNEYRIPAILFDGRLFSSQEPQDQALVGGVANRITAFADRTTVIDAGLREMADVYYKPTRTLGNAIFGIGNNQTIEKSLSLNFNVNVFVDPAVYNTDVAKETMDATIVRLINGHIQDPIISVVRLGEVINTALGSGVTDVVVKFKDDPDLVVIALEDANCKPSIEHILSLEPDNTIRRQPNVTITYTPKPNAIVDVIKDTL